MNAIALSGLLLAATMSFAEEPLVCPDQNRVVITAPELQLFKKLAPLIRAKSHFEHLGFACSAYDPKRGIRCRGKVDSTIYSEEVVIFIPPDYAVVSNVDMIVHFHGNLVNGHSLPVGPLRDRLKKPGATGTSPGHFDTETLDDVLDRFDFGKMLAESRKSQSLLILPASRGANDTHNKLFVQEGRFPAFMEHVSKLISDSGLSRFSEPKSVAITSHSGGYKTAATVIHQKPYAEKIKEVYLFDSAYDKQPYTGLFADWASQSGNRFVSVINYGTVNGNAAVWRQLSAQKRQEICSQAAAKKCEQNAIVQPPEPDWQHVRRAETAFIRSDADHWDTVNKYFPLIFP